MLYHPDFVPMLPVDFPRVNTTRFLSRHLFMTLIRAIWVVLRIKLSPRCSLKVCNAWETISWLLMRLIRWRMLQRFPPAYLMLDNCFRRDFFLVAAQQELIYLFAQLINFFVRLCLNFNNPRLPVFLLNYFRLFKWFHSRICLFLKLRRVLKPIRDGLLLLCIIGSWRLYWGCLLA
jgi:hypothetical protein